MGRAEGVRLRACRRNAARTLRDSPQGWGRAIPGGALRSVPAPAPRGLIRERGGRKRGRLQANAGRFQRIRSRGGTPGPANGLWNGGAVLFFQLVNARHERASTVLTSNKGFEDWGRVLGNEVMAAAPIDRLVHRCHIVNIRGNSYRMRDHQNLMRSGTDRRRRKDGS